MHFCNRTSDCSLVVEVKDGLAPIPNILLQDARPIRVYAYVDDKYTLTEEQITVKSRTRPDDYVYTETDIIRWQTIADEAEKANSEALEAAALASATAKDLYDYVAENKLTFTDDDAGNVTLQGIETDLDVNTLATKDYVADAIANIPEPDLSAYATRELLYSYDESVRNDFSEELEYNYYTQTETDNKIKAAVDAIDIPEVDFTGYATETYVNDAVAAIEVPSDEHINSLINDALGVIENGSY